MKRPRTLLLGTLLLCFAGTGQAQEAELSDEEKVGRVTGFLICQCGCANKVVRSCACATAIEVTKDVRKLVAGGKSEEQIFALYEEKYGPQVLGAPKLEGFNIVGWVLPFVAAAFGTLIVVVVFKKLKPAQEEIGEGGEKPLEISDKYRKLLDQELRDR